MAKSIHRAVWEWLKGCEKLTKLFFNFGTQSAEATIMVPNDVVNVDFISGAEEHAYNVELARFLPLTFSANDDNITMLEDVDAILDWIRQMGDEGRYPDLPEGCSVTGIHVQNAAAGYVYSQNGVYAKYQIPFTIEYTKEPN